MQTKSLRRNISFTTYNEDHTPFHHNKYGEELILALDSHTYMYKQELVNYSLGTTWTLCNSALQQVHSSHRDNKTHALPHTPHKFNAFSPYLNSKVLYSKCNHVYVKLYAKSNTKGSLLFYTTGMSTHKIHLNLQGPQLSREKIQYFGYKVYMCSA